RLGEFDPNVAPANHQPMLGNYVQLECLDVGERLRFSKTGDRSQCGPRTGTHDHVGATELTAAPIRQGDLQRSRSYEPSGSRNELRSRGAEVIQVDLVQAGHHRALAVPDARHIDLEAVFVDTEFLASAKVRGDLRAVDDILARQARDVRARSADVLALDHGDPLA